ncbi:MAG: hypothetical protein QNJ54_08685 [Prochloraceae cyanobacterium]|nr:hypothetical protein [Prochloraceae cyanobacterium]
MTSKLQYRSIRSPVFSRQIKNCSSVALGICLAIFSSNVTLAQEIPLVVEVLPPPPPLIPESNNLIRTPEKTKQNSRIDREYNFQAPNTTRSNQRYRVEVYGSSSRILTQVRRVAPKAFRKGGVIQAGIFQHSQNAQDLVLELTSRGLWTRIVAVDRR